MRIQETDKILKEGRIARHHADHDSGSSLWKWLSGSAVALLAVTGLFVYLRRNS